MSRTPSGPSTVLRFDVNATRSRQKLVVAKCSAAAAASREASACSKLDSHRSTSARASATGGTAMSVMQPPPVTGRANMLADTRVPRQGSAPRIGDRTDGGRVPGRDSPGIDGHPDPKEPEPMYAQLIEGGTTPERRTEMDRIVTDQMVPALHAEPGFAGALNLVDRDSGDALMVVLWESEAHARRPLSEYGP